MEYASKPRDKSGKPRESFIPSTRPRYIVGLGEETRVLMEA